MADDSARKALLPVTVIGGYLGAGKTTLVNHLLRNHGGRRIAVAVNEFGALPIDTDLIQGADGNVLTLAGGCICCSFGNDLIAGLVDLARRRDTLDHIVIEASGVALPGGVAQSVGLVMGLELDGIVVVVDAETVRARAADRYMGDTIERQLADADMVLINKSDLVTEATRQEVAHWLSGLLPQARQIFATQAAVAPELILGSSTATGFEPSAPRATHASDEFQSIVVTFSQPVDVNALASALAVSELGLVRAKGFVRDHDGGWRTLQVVGRRAQVSPASGLDRSHSQIVCITHGRAIDRARIDVAVFAASQDP